MTFIAWKSEGEFINKDYDLMAEFNTEVTLRDCPKYKWYRLIRDKVLIWDKGYIWDESAYTWDKTFNCDELYKESRIKYYTHALEIPLGITLAQCEPDLTLFGLEKEYKHEIKISVPSLKKLNINPEWLGEGDKIEIDHHTYFVVSLEPVADSYWMSSHKNIELIVYTSEVDRGKY